MGRRDVPCGAQYANLQAVETMGVEPNTGNKTYRDAIYQLGTRDWANAFRVLDSAGAAAVADVLWGTTLPNTAIRKWCVALLDHHGDRTSVPVLRHLLSDSSPTVRRHAVHSIGCQRCKPEPLDCAVVDLLLDRIEHDPSPRVRRVAAHQLGCQPQEAHAAPTIARLLSTERSSRVRSVLTWTLRMHTRT